MEEADRKALVSVEPEIRRRLLLEQPAPAELVTRFQQTTGAVMAMGVENTALYRYSRLLALNEVGGDPGRFSISIERFHDGNRLLATTTHDTKRSGDVRARLAALTWLPEEWAGLVRELRIEGEDEYLTLQTVVGAWPLEVRRLDAYLVKTLREGKRSSSWLGPDEADRAAGAGSGTALARPPGRRRLRRAVTTARQADLARDDAAQADRAGSARHLPGGRARVPCARRSGQPSAGRLGPSAACA